MKRRVEPVLQIALDIPDIFKALKLAAKISERLGCENIWVEAGTPLIKNWGTLAVKALKQVGECFVVADTKTMDTGRLEAELMIKAGADAVTVLGLADDQTIREAVEAARRRGRMIMVDLINHPDPVNRAIAVDKMGADIVLYHVGIDTQRRRGITATDMVEEIKMLGKRINARIAVAGGIKHGGAKPLVEAGAGIIIVGGAITKAEDPLASARKFLEEILGAKTQGS